MGDAFIHLTCVIERGEHIFLFGETLAIGMLCVTALIIVIMLAILRRMRRLGQTKGRYWVYPYLTCESKGQYQDSQCHLEK